MALDYAVAIGMKPADIFLEVERQKISKRDLLLGHAVLKQFDDFDLRHDVYSPKSIIAGFAIEVSSRLLIFHHAYGSRHKGIVEEAIIEMHPDQKHLFTNTSVDHGGYVTIRGILANKLMEHPYIRACFGFTKGEETRDNLAIIRMEARMSAFDMLGFQRPTKETLELMFATMKHNMPRYNDEFQRLLDWKRNLRTQTDTVSDDHIKDIAGIAGLLMLSKQEMRQMGEHDLRMIEQRRLRFLSRHQGAEAIFSPFAPEDELLVAIRNLVHETMNMMEVDEDVEARIGRDAWSEFVIDPKAFCDARIEQPVSTIDDDDPSMEM